MTVKIVINKNWKITYSGMRYCLGHDGVYVVYVSALQLFHRSQHKLNHYFENIPFDKVTKRLKVDISCRLTSNSLLTYTYLINLCRNV